MGEGHAQKWRNSQSLRFERACKLQHMIMHHLQAQMEDNTRAGQAPYRDKLGKDPVAKPEVKVALLIG